MHLSMMMSCELKQTLTKQCPVCKDREHELDGWDVVHNMHLGMDPTEALSRGVCPSCYLKPKRMSAAWQNRLAKWMTEELKKKVPAWREPAIPTNEEPFRAVQTRLFWYSRDLHDRYVEQGGCRGLFDYASAEFKNTNIPAKVAMLKELKSWGISEDEIRAACVRYLEVISKEPYWRAQAFISEGWSLVMHGW